MRLPLETQSVLGIALFPGLPNFRSPVCLQYNTLRSSASMYYTERKLENKNRGGPGMKLL